MLGIGLDNWFRCGASSGGGGGVVATPAIDAAVSGATNNAWFIRTDAGGELFSDDVATTPATNGGAVARLNSTGTVQAFATTGVTWDQANGLLSLTDPHDLAIDTTPAVGVYGADYSFFCVLETTDPEFMLSGTTSSKHWGTAQNGNGGNPTSSAGNPYHYVNYRPLFENTRDALSDGLTTGTLCVVEVRGLDFTLTSGWHEIMTLMRYNNTTFSMAGKAGGFLMCETPSLSEREAIYQDYKAMYSGLPTLLAQEATPNPNAPGLLVGNDDMEDAAWVTTTNITVSGNTLTANGVNNVHRHINPTNAIATATDYFVDVDFEPVDAVAFAILVTRSSQAQVFNRSVVDLSNMVVSQYDQTTNVSDGGNGALRTIIPLGSNRYRLRHPFRQGGGGLINNIALLICATTTGVNGTASTGFHTDAATGSVIIHDVVIYENV